MEALDFIEFPDEDTLDAHAEGHVPLTDLSHINYPSDALVIGEHNLSNIPNRWSPKLVYDLALGLDPLDDVLLRHGLSINEYNAVADNPVFRRELVVATKELQENGVPFKRKAAIQAELYLDDMDQLMRDQLTPPSVKTDIFKTMARLGELEPEKKSESSDRGSQFNIQINLN